jgi:hypothetical protein
MAMLSPYPPPLPGPLEILEMGDGEVRTLAVVGWETGAVTLTPVGRLTKTVLGVRLHVRPDSKGMFPFYWDLTAATLVAQVIPTMEAHPGQGVILEVTKSGVAPKARYGVAVRGVFELVAA